MPGPLLDHRIVFRDRHMGKTEGGKTVRFVLCHLDAFSHYLALLAGRTVYLSSIADLYLFYVYRNEVCDHASITGTATNWTDGLPCFVDGHIGVISDYFQRERLR